MKDKTLQAFIRQRHAAMRRRSLLMTIVFAGITPFLLNSRGLSLPQSMVRLSPSQSIMAAILCGELACVGVLRFVSSCLPVRYRDGPLVAHRSIIGALAYSVVTIILAALSILFAVAFSPIGYLVTIPAVALIGLAILQVPEVFNGRAVLTIDSEGFFDRRFTRRPVPWSQMGSLIPSSTSDAWPFFRPVDDPGNSTLMRRIYSRLGFPFLYVSFGALDRGGADVLLAIDRYAPELTAALVRGS